MKINMQHGTIGSRHDPYGTEVVEVCNGTRTAIHYSDGLGRYRITLLENGKQVRQVEWVISFNKTTNKLRRLKAGILFRRHVGIDVDDAAREFERTYEADPYGGPGRYV